MPRSALRGGRGFSVPAALIPSMNSSPIIRKAQTGEPTGNGGHFGANTRLDGTVTLKPAIERAEVQSWLFLNGLNLNEAGAEEMTTRLNAGGSDSTLRRVDIFRDVHHDIYGFSHEDAAAVYKVAENLRDVGDSETSVSLFRILDAAQKTVSPSFVPSAQAPGVTADEGDGSFARPKSLDSAEVQAGEVFDFVVAGSGEEGMVYARSKEGTYADWPYAVRIQANRPLTDAEVEHLGDLTAYSLGSTVRGETLGGADRDSPYSFILSHDSTKGNGEGFEKFEEQLPEIVADGSRLRTTDRAGAGTAGTRAVEALPDSDGLVFEIYYDSFTPGS